MKPVAAWAALFLLPMTAVAEPQVVGYERFHSEAPGAAGGALLYSELGCANCHGGSAVAVPRKGPSLENLSSRVERDWVLKFLKNPEASRKGSTMPVMMHGMPDEDLEAVTAYLSTIGKGLKFKIPRHANAEHGSAIYHEKGCVACHAPTGDYQGPAGKGADLASPHAIAHPNLKEKTSLMALEHFLANASRYRTDGRMPHTELGHDGAINVAAHLLDLQGSDPRAEKILTPWPKADGAAIARGKAIAEQASCIACHDLPGIEPAKLVDLEPKPAGDGHCLTPNPKQGLPRYDLTDKQRLSLLAFLAGPRAEKDADGTLTLQAMNCYACHQRDGIGGPSPKTALFFHGEESLGDSGKLPPPLTGIGHKLRKDWLEGVLAGKAETRVRPYLKTAMPAYPAHAKAMAEWLEGLDAKPDAKPLAEIHGKLEDGRKLLGTQGGVNCIMCHNWGDQRSLGIPALDIASLDKRLRPEWFRSYLLNPATYRPGTLMPPLWPGGKSSIPDVLDGDTEKQMAAIWEFIAKGKGSPEGFPDRSGGLFDLKPTDRPIVQRAFFTGAGTKAILVGFPGEIHIAYDGNAGHPTLVWRGAFFDAYSTWFSRMAPFEKPLGKQVDSFPAVESERRFRGYELDDKGNPTFLFIDAGRLVKERFEVRDGKLERSLSWEQGKTPELTHPKGVNVELKQSENSLKAIYQWK